MFRVVFWIVLGIGLEGWRGHPSGPDTPGTPRSAPARPQVRFRRTPEPQIHDSQFLDTVARRGEICFRGTPRRDVVGPAVMIFGQPEGIVLGRPKIFPGPNKLVLDLETCFGSGNLVSELRKFVPD